MAACRADNISPFHRTCGPEEDHAPNFNLFGGGNANEATISRAPSEWGMGSAVVAEQSVASAATGSAILLSHRMSTQWDSHAIRTATTTPELESVPTVLSAGACLDVMLQRLTTTTAAMPQLQCLLPWAWVVLNELVASPLSLDVPPTKLAALVLTCCYAACGAGFGAPRAAIALFRLTLTFTQDTQPQVCLCSFGLQTCLLVKSVVSKLLSLQHQKEHTIYTMRILESVGRIFFLIVPWNKPTFHVATSNLHV